MTSRAVEADVCVDATISTQESLRARGILAVIARSTDQSKRARGEERLRKSQARHRTAHR